MKDLCDVTVGDKVVHSRMFNPDTVIEVTKVTKTLIICGSMRFNKQTGKNTGSDTWGTSQIHYPLDGEIEAINNEQFVQSVIRKLRLLDPVDITYEQAVKVKEIFNW